MKCFGKPYLPAGFISFFVQVFGVGILLIYFIAIYILSCGTFKWECANRVVNSFSDAIESWSRHA